MEFVKPNSTAHIFQNFTENSWAFKKMKIFDQEIYLKFWMDQFDQDPSFCKEFVRVYQDAFKIFDEFKFRDKQIIEKNWEANIPETLSEELKDKFLLIR